MVSVDHISFPSAGAGPFHIQGKERVYDVCVCECVCVWKGRERERRGGGCCGEVCCVVRVGGVCVMCEM